MKKLSSLVLLTLLVKTGVSLEVSPSLVDLTNFAVKSRGRVLFNPGNTNTSLVAIPITLQLPDTCTTFVGELERTVSNPILIRPIHAIVPPTHYQEIRLLGARDRLQPMCTAQVPAPRELEITTTVPIVPGAKSVTQLISLASGYYHVTLMIPTNEVRITRVFFAH